MNWSAEQYSKFETERNRPVRDLLAAVSPTEVRIAADIGCGPGNSTELLHEWCPEASVLGIDNSPAMIDAARVRLPNVRFDVADITGWEEPGPFDLILANAALQWVPDHALVIPTLLDKLASKGRLAIQIPDNWEEPAHQLMREVAVQAPWAQKLLGATGAHDNRHAAGWYYEFLHTRARTIDIWRTTYFHELPQGPIGVVEWFKGTALRPFLDRLDEEERSVFLARYQQLIETAYPPFSNGVTLLPFPRLLMVVSV